jgi:meso-butanediol dehydrogenase/(S,S)-butanediol dehydrogenase/diacetyl reductase
MPDLSGKVAVITGGASGMGAATARVMVRDGCKVVLGDLNTDALAAICDELGADKAVGRTCDVADEGEVTALVDTAVKQFGRLDILFNNAGIGGLGSVTDTTSELWRKVIDIDLNAVFYGSRAAVPHMRAGGGGAIINTASVSGMFGDYGMSSYCAAKGGVINLSRNMALDFARDGIRVNCICPGAIDTPLFAGMKAAPSLFDAFVSAVPMKRLGDPNEIAEVVAFLASSAASYITGAVIPIDGGLTSKTGWPDMNDFMEELKGVFG